LTHGDVLDEEGLGTGLSVIGRSGGIAVAIQSEDKTKFGVQFHPEVRDHIEDLNLILFQL